MPTIDRHVLFTDFPNLHTIRCLKQNITSVSWDPHSSKQGNVVCTIKRCSSTNLAKTVDRWLGRLATRLATVLPAGWTPKIVIDQWICRFQPFIKPLRDVLDRSDLRISQVEVHLLRLRDVDLLDIFGPLMKQRWGSKIKPNVWLRLTTSEVSDDNIGICVCLKINSHGVMHRLAHSLAPFHLGKLSVTSSMATCSSFLLRYEDFVLRFDTIRLEISLRPTDEDVIESILSGHERYLRRIARGNHTPRSHTGSVLIDFDPGRDALPGRYLSVNEHICYMARFVPTIAYMCTPIIESSTKAVRLSLSHDKFLKLLLQEEDYGADDVEEALPYHQQMLADTLKTSRRNIGLIREIARRTVPSDVIE